jgi:hypothetical protein
MRVFVRGRLNVVVVAVGAREVCEPCDLDGEAGFGTVVNWDRTSVLGVEWRREWGTYLWA